MSITVKLVYEVKQAFEKPGHRRITNRERKSNDPKKFLAAAEKGLITFFADNSYPDKWGIWESAKRDTMMALAFGKKTLREE